MESEIAVLSQKIDTLAGLVSAQQAQIQAMAALLEGQARQQAEFEDLKSDLLPVANQVIKLSIDELAEIGADFELHDLLFLLKRLLRDTNLLLDLLGRMEGLVELNDEVQVVGKQAFNQTISTLDRLEREGYFAFARGGWRILEKVMQEFDQDDLNALGDNIVLILKTVRNLTQPEIMKLTNQSLEAIRQGPPSNGQYSLWAMLKDLNDPQVRKGLGRLVNLLRVLAEEPVKQ